MLNKLTVELNTQEIISKPEKFERSKPEGLGMQSPKILASSWRGDHLDLQKIFEDVAFKGAAAEANTGGGLPFNTQIHGEGLKKVFDELGINLSPHLKLPEKNPLTLQKIDWKVELKQSTMDDFLRESSRAAKKEVHSEDAKTNRLIQMMFLALRSGNIGMAMLIFSQMESKEAGQLNEALLSKMMQMKEKKNELTKKMTEQKNDENGMKEMQKIKNEVENVCDDINVLQTFMKDVTQNKQQAMEMAQNFIAQENQTTQNIIQKG